MSKSIAAQSCDFSSGELPAALLECDPDVETLIVIEGVFMYLDKVQVDELLQTLSDRFPSHTLICDLMNRVFFKRHMGKMYDQVLRSAVNSNSSKPNQKSYSSSGDTNNQAHRYPSWAGHETSRHSESRTFCCAPRCAACGMDTAPTPSNDTGKALPDSHSDSSYRAQIGRSSTSTSSAPKRPPPSHFSHDAYPEPHPGDLVKPVMRAIRLKRNPAGLFTQASDPNTTDTRRAPTPAPAWVTPDPVPGCRVQSLGVMRYVPVASAAYVERYLPHGFTSEASAAPSLAWNRNDALQDMLVRKTFRRNNARPVHYVPKRPSLAGR